MLVTDHLLGGVESLMCDFIVYLHPIECRLLGGSMHIPICDNIVETCGYLIMFPVVHQSIGCGWFACSIVCRVHLVRPDKLTSPVADLKVHFPFGPSSKLAYPENQTWCLFHLGKLVWILFRFLSPFYTFLDAPLWPCPLVNINMGPFK